MLYQVNEATEPVLTFSSFRFFPARRLLYEADRPLRLGGRAVDILHVLLERAGEIVTKEQLIAHVWPDTVVEEGNLRVHVAALRKTLGDGGSGPRHIESVVGRGYCFIAPVLRSDEAAPAAIAAAAATAAAAAEAAEPCALPPPMQRMVGRAHTVATLGAQLAERRFVSIVGTGGMGKTTVALAIAEAVQAAGRRVCLVDLAPLNDPAQVPAALAAALGQQEAAADPAAALRGQDMLIVFDSCEHLLEAVSVLAEQILRGTTAVKLLATSREPLRADGEWVHRLPALEQPPEGAALTLEQAMAYPSVQLFVERVQASAAAPALGDADVAAMGELCRRLDGIPLALELAAARVELFGVRGLAARLDDSFLLLKGGRRTAKVRHRTLEATLDWSYALLGDTERAVLRRLSVFRHSFTLEAALQLGEGGEVRPGEAMEALSNLVSKSLLAAVSEGGAARYRLLDTTRSYAAAKLADSGEQAAVLARYAELADSCGESA